MTQQHTTDTMQEGKETAFIAEAHERFLLVFAACDCSSIMQIIGISRFNLLKYRRVHDACIVVYIVLWYHALLRSFPVHSSAMLDYFIKENLPRFYSCRRVAALEIQVRHVIDAMSEKGDGDFTVLGKYLLEIAKQSHVTDVAVKQLKLVLHVRLQYENVYNNLI